MKRSKYICLRTNFLKLCISLACVFLWPSQSVFAFSGTNTPETSSERSGLLIEVQSGGVGLLPDLLNRSRNLLGQENNAEEDDFSLQPELGELSRGAISLPNPPSLLFYPAQMKLIKDFERGVLFPEPQEKSVVEVQEVPDLKPPEPKVTTEPAPEQEKFVPPTEPSIRELYLSGIAYNGPKSWTIWLNGSRVTPATVPEEIFRINVEDEYVELIWHDKQTHNVFPIRLRPNQRFNLDARMFLPG